MEEVGEVSGKDKVSYFISMAVLMTTGPVDVQTPLAQVSTVRGGLSNLVAKSLVHEQSAPNLPLTHCASTIIHQLAKNWA